MTLISRCLFREFTIFPRKLIPCEINILNFSRVMFLFAKSTIVNYINSHPESRIALILWLKYFEIQPPSFYQDSTIDCSYQNGSGIGGFTGDYTVVYEINSYARALLVTWVGSKAELEEKQRIEQEEFERFNREVLDGEIVSGNFTATGKGVSRKPVKPDSSIPTFNSDLQEKIESFNLGIHPSKINHFQTFEDYELGVNKAISLFSSYPGSSNFQELLMLLFKIDHYERNVLVFPQATLNEFIMHMMDFFKLEIPDFNDILTTDEFESFLSGRLKLKAYPLKRILTRVGLKFFYGEVKQ